MKIYRLKIKSKNSFDNFIKVYIIISTTLFFIVSNAWCQESVDQVKGKGKIVGWIVNADMPSADSIEYLLYRPIFPSSSIIQEGIDQQFDEIINSGILYQKELRHKILQDSDVRRIIRQIPPQKLLEVVMERDAWARHIMEGNFQTYYEHKYEFSRCEQIYLTDIFISFCLNTMPEKCIERL